MNKLKGIFVLLFPPLAYVLALVSIAMIAKKGADPGWIGALVAGLPFIGLQLRAHSSWSMARTSHSLHVLTVITLSGFALAVYDFVDRGGEGSAALIVAALATAGFLLYDFWYSTLGRQISDRLATGRQLPDFSLEDSDGNEVTSQSLQGKPVLLMFYRGNWCPICMAQVEEIAGQYKALIDRGVTVCLISPQPPEITGRVADVFGVPFRFLVDKDLAAARALSIVHDDGVPYGPLIGKFGNDTVYPTVIITDPAGKILYTDQTANYRVRPEPEIFFRVLKANGY